MSEHMQTTVNALKERFNATEIQFRGQTTMLVLPEHLIAACMALRDEFGFELLAEETAVDYWPQTEPRFHVAIGIRSIKHNLLLLLRVPLNGNDPSVASLEPIWKNANWFEREIWDMFGIHFEGHSDVRRILMPEDWVGHPLRKDYPLGYEEVQFTFNFDEVNQRKSYAKE